MATAIGIIGLLVAGGAAIASRRSQKKARKFQEKGQLAQRNIADLQNARSRRQQLVQARRARAQIIAQGENAGIGGGSQVSGAVGSVQTQAAENVSFLNQLQGFDANRFQNLEKANSALGKASTFQAISGVGFQVAGNAQSIANVIQ